MCMMSYMLTNWYFELEFKYITKPKYRKRKEVKMKKMKAQKVISDLKKKLNPRVITLKTWGRAA